MQLFPDARVLLSIGDIRITWYAVFILSGALIAYRLSVRTLKRWGYEEDLLENFFFPMLLVGILGARLYYVIFEWQTQYAMDPIRVFYIWEGGLAIHGGLLAATLFGLWYFHRNKADGLRVMDAIFPNVLLAQAFGRWGNFVNQEAYGRIVSEAYFNGWPSFLKEGMYIGGAYREPTFLYESVANLLGFALITFVYKKYGRRKRGDLAWAYLMWYGAVRFVIESMRSDALMAGDLRVAQIVSALFLAIGVCGMLGLWNRLFAGIWPFRKGKPAVLFDLDGTLIDSRALVDASFVHTMAQLRPQHKVSRQEKDAFFGPPLTVSFRRYFDTDEEVEQAIAVYRAYNIAHHDTFIREMPGAKELLGELRMRGYALGVLSNKMRDVVEMGLRQTHLQDYFDVVLGGDDLPKPKPDPSGILLACQKLRHNHDDVVYVGDSAGDIQAAKNMGAYSVAFVSDPTREADLAACKPCALVHDLKAISGLLKEEREWNDPMI